jgi:hypothetical protein
MFRKLKQLIQRLFTKEPDPPVDPYAFRPVPVRRGPPNRSDSVALAEPDEEEIH